LPRDAEPIRSAAHQPKNPTIEEADVTQKTTKTPARGDKALELVNDSIDAAQAALKDLRSEMSRGSRELLKDVETTLRDAHMHLRNVTRHVSKDLEEVQHAVVGKRRPAKRKSAARTTAPRKSAAKK
jgi:ABC-type transporter Mla subunit MlaD